MCAFGALGIEPLAWLDAPRVCSVEKTEPGGNQPSKLGKTRSFA